MLKGEKSVFINAENSKACGKAEERGIRRGGQKSLTEPLEIDDHPFLWENSGGEGTQKKGEFHAGSFIAASNCSTVHRKKGYCSGG